LIEGIAPSEDKQEKHPRTEFYGKSSSGNPFHSILFATFPDTRARDIPRLTCDEDEAAIEGEEGADAVEEVLEVDLVPDESRRAIGGTELHEPAGEIYAHLLVPEPPTMESTESAGEGGGGRNTDGREQASEGFGTHWRWLSGSFCLQESRMSHRFLTPMAATAAGHCRSGRRRRRRRRKGDWWWGFGFGFQNCKRLFSG
jgi:hypothetical protein